MITFDRKKDKVAIIAPSSACRDKEGNFDREISRSNLEVAISLFEEHGFSCKYDEKIFAGGSLEYFAASKEERLKQLIEAIEEALSVSSEKWKEMGLCARDFVTKNFSTEKSLEYHKDILLSL